MYHIYRANSPALRNLGKLAPLDSFMYCTAMCVRSLVLGGSGELPANAMDPRQLQVIHQTLPSPLH